jgi:hypothetical protein
MNVQMQNAESLSQGQIQQFLESSEEIDFVGQGRAEVYAWVQQVLVKQEFARMRKKERGRVRAYLEKITGRSAAQLTRLIAGLRPNTPSKTSCCWPLSTAHTSA